MVDRSSNFTLELHGAAGSAIRVADTAYAYNYTTVANAVVRFVKSNSVVYVYENNIFKTTVTQSASTTGPGITGATGSPLYIPSKGFGPVINPDYTAGDYIDMTSRIQNPGFEGSSSGWANNGFFSQTNNSFAKEGDTYMERWVWSGGQVPDVSIVQTVTRLPIGKYTLRLAAQNISEANPGNQSGGFAVANTGRFPVNAASDYGFNFLVVDSSATIGYKTTSSTGNWVAVDNFRLQYRGKAGDSMRTSLQVMKDSGTVVMNKKIQNLVRTTLADAVNNAGVVLGVTASTPGELAAAIVQLQNALSSADLSVNAFGNMQAAIDSATTLYGSGGGNKADSLLLAIQKGQTLNNNLDSDVPALNNGRAELYKAIFAYRIANATGAAPTVVTDPRFARGATAAFGRCTVSGAATTEEGFCWSTSPNPTILDNTTTKSFYNNGTIYRIENLQPGTVYYMRAYAITAGFAVGYGNVLKVITIPQGNESYYLNGSPESWGPDNYSRVKSAVEGGIYYHNNYTSIRNHNYFVNVNSGTPTAEGGYGGYMQFGTSPGYQRTGTAMHEMAHTIGVGQHYMWYGPNSPLRQYGGSGGWLGDRTNNVLKFLNNDPYAQLQGDAVHFWPYGINGAFEDNGSDFLYCANALIVEGLGEDGLPPSGGFATPAYTFDQEDTVKYYLKTEEIKTGRDVSFLAQNAFGQLYSKVISATEVLQNDSAAWYITFIPSTSYYRFKNAATGEYLTYTGSYGSNGIKLAATDAPDDYNSFQLMAARYKTEISKNGKTLNFRPYSIARPENWMDPPTLTAEQDGSTSANGYNFYNDATTQHWLILSKSDVDSFKTVEVGNIPIVKTPRAASGDARSALTWGFKFGLNYAILRSASETGNYDTIATGVTGARFVDSSIANGSTDYYRVVAYNGNASTMSPVLTAWPKLGQQLYISFNDTATAEAEDKWGGYHATFVNEASRDSNSVNKFLRLNGNAYASLAEGPVSGLNNFTISTWVKITSLNDWARIFDFGKGTDNYMYLAAQTYNSDGLSNMVYAIKNGGNEQVLSFKYAWQLNTWTHVVISQSNDSTKMYINGLNVANSTQISIRPAALGNTFNNYLGKSQFNDPYLNGAIDEFRIYNYAMNHDEIQELYGNLPVAAPIAVISPRTASGDGRATIVWQNQNDAMYSILRSGSPNGIYDTIATKVDALRYTDTGRTNNTDYYYKVWATNIAGSSPMSDVMSATPKKGQYVNINFDDTAARKAIDIWNAYDAELSTGAAKATGKVGSGLILDGTGGSYAKLHEGVITDLNNFTISTWVKMRSLNDWMRIFDFGKGTNNYMYLSPQTYSNNGLSNIAYAIKNGGGEQQLSFQYAWPMDTWTHVALSQSDDSTKLYINGVKVAGSKDISIRPADLGNTANNYLGKSQFNDPYLHGDIDEFRIYNYAMPANEVASLSSNNILPLTLLSLTGNSTPLGNQLRWTITATEPMKIDLEKSSNGRDFGSIHQTDALPASGQSFAYTDVSAGGPVSYYRLKMTGHDGNITYSPLLAISSSVKKGTSVVGLYPNIVSAMASLSITSAVPEDLTIRISDMRGIVVRTLSRNVAQGSNVFAVNLGQLTPGSYLLSVFERTGQVVGTIKFVKIK